MNVGRAMKFRVSRTAEHVGEGHPDKYCDQVADAILDETYRLCGDNAEDRRQVRTAIECLAKDNLVVVSGETRWPAHVQARLMCGGDGLDVHGIAKHVWRSVGYGNGDQVAVLNNIRSQSVDIAQGDGSGVDAGGAGDQGIMVGYATDETSEMMPKEWVLARDICQKLKALGSHEEHSWLRSDCKSQVTLDPNGRVTNIIVAVQHSENTDMDHLRREVFRLVLQPLVDDGSVGSNLQLEANGRFRYGSVHGAINGTGRFVTGGSIGDAGVVGRKIVVDAYGPRVPVGGGAYSGKDPSKVDRSAAYMARYLARAVVEAEVGGAKECMVQIAYGIGQLEPEMVTAVTDKGDDVTPWIIGKFPMKELRPVAIIERFGLRNPSGWSYQDTAAYGHYGRPLFPWEGSAD